MAVRISVRKATLVASSVLAIAGCSNNPAEPPADVGTVQIINASAAVDVRIDDMPRIANVAIGAVPNALLHHMR